MDRTNTELSRLSELIGLIYEGATDLSLWPNTILPAVAEYIDAPACILYTNLHTPQDGGYFFFHGITQEHVDQYVHKHYHEDVWKIAIEERNIYTSGTIVLGDELVPREQLLASNFYRDCLARNKNMVQLLTGFVFGVEEIYSMPTACSFFRGSHHPDFTEENRERLRLILPHLSRSLGVMQRLRSAELAVASTLSALDRLSHGVLLIDANGAVTFANRSAQCMLEDGEGLYLRKLTNKVELGDLVAEDSVSSKAITDAISVTLSRDPYTIQHFSKSVKVPRTSGLASYTLQFSALGKHGEFGGGNNEFAAIVFIADGSQEIYVDPVLLQGAYELTPAEVRVAIALLESCSAKDVADKLGTSANTVNTQIKQIYAKLGVDTRTRFVKLMLGLASHPH